MVSIYLDQQTARNAAADLFTQFHLARLNDELAPPPADNTEPDLSAPPPAQASTPSQPPAISSALAPTSTPPTSTAPVTPASPPPTAPVTAPLQPPPTPAVDRNQVADQFTRNAIADAWQNNAIADVVKGVSQAGQGVQTALAGVPQQAQGLVSNLTALPGAQQQQPSELAPGANLGIPRPSVSAGQVATVTGPQDSNLQVDSSSPEAFIRSIAPAAQNAAARLGVPAEALIAMAANETGYGKYAAGNNLFGIKGAGPAGSTNAGTWEDYGNGPVQTTANFRAYDNAQQSFDDFANLIAGSDRYKAALGQPTVEGFVGALKAGGYMTDPNYVGKISNIVKTFAPTIADALSGGAAAGGQPQTQQAASAGQPVALDRTSQFQLGLSAADALAACGPAAAIAFAKAYGRMPSVDEAMQLAQQSGWTQGGGMNGVVNEKKLLDALGVPTKLQTGSISWQQVTQDVQNGNPVIISTPGHYFTADDVQQNPNGSTLYHVGTSGTDLKRVMPTYGRK